MDFKKATELFADPQFDGEPVQIYEPTADDPIVPPEEDTPESDEDGKEEIGTKEERMKYVVDDVPVQVAVERVQHYDKDGKLITESLRDYTRQTIRQQYTSLSAFLRRWSEAERKQVIVQELENQGVLFEALAEEVDKDFDSFDLICHVVFEQPPLTRRERAGI